MAVARDFWGGEANYLLIKATKTGEFRILWGSSQPREVWSITLVDPTGRVLTVESIDRWQVYCPD